MSGAIPMPLSDDEVAQALDIARQLVYAGVPVFVAPPAPGTKVGFRLPEGWEYTLPHPSAINAWRPGWALCAIGGHACDFLDLDPRNGGVESSEQLWKAGRWPNSYGTAYTPSGGTHYLIQPLGVGKGEIVPGVDLQGGRADGGGRGFVFIAPTVRASKVDGIARPYRWAAEALPDLERLKSWRGEQSGAGLAALLPERKSKPKNTQLPQDDFAPEETHTTIAADRCIAGKGQEVTESARRGWGQQFRDTLNRSAYTLGAYVGSGYMTEQQATDHLCAAIQLAGYLPDDNDLRWIAQGIADGAKYPIKVVRPQTPFARTAEASGEPHRVLVDGDTFLSEVPEDEPALWGDKDACLWAPGESLMLVGPPGVGKSTLAHLLVFGALGLLPDALSFPVTSGRSVLYLAMDRPRQIARAMRRLRTEEARVALKEHLTVHKGPLPVRLADDADWILRQAQEVGAGIVVVDSIKDLLPDLSDESSASLYNRARQLCLAQGIEWLELHHNRKASAGNEEPKSLDDVYGSRWLTAGAGSVLSLWGQSGDAVVRLSQIKTPSGELFPRWVTIDKETGAMATQQGPRLSVVVEQTGRTGITAKEAATFIYDVKSPSRSQKETARQKLDRLVRDGVAFKGGDEAETRYYAVASARGQASADGPYAAGQSVAQNISDNPYV